MSSISASRMMVRGPSIRRFDGYLSEEGQRQDDMRTSSGSAQSVQALLEKTEQERCSRFGFLPELLPLVDSTPGFTPCPPKNHTLSNVTATPLHPRSPTASIVLCTGSKSYQLASEEPDQEKSATAFAAQWGLVLSGQKDARLVLNSAAGTPPVVDLGEYATRVCNVPHDSSCHAVPQASNIAYNREAPDEDPRLFFRTLQHQVSNALREQQQAIEEDERRRWERAEELRRTHLRVQQENEKAMLAEAERQRLLRVTEQAQEQRKKEEIRERQQEKQRAAEGVAEQQARADAATLSALTLPVASSTSLPALKPSNPEGLVLEEGSHHVSAECISPISEPISQGLELDSTTKERLSLRYEWRQYINGTIAHIKNAPSPEMRRFRLGVKKPIVLAINQLASTTSQIKQVAGRLQETLTSLAAQAFEIREGGYCASSYHYSVALLLETLLDNVEVQVVNNPRAVWGFAALLARLTSETRSTSNTLKQQFESALYARAAIAIPFHRAWVSSSAAVFTDKDWQDRRPGEAAVKHAQRMAGYVRLWLAFLVVCQDSTSLWSWFSRFLNAPQEREDLSPFILSAALELCGFFLIRYFPKQFPKILHLIESSILPHYEQQRRRHNSALSTPIAQVQIMLDAFKKTRDLTIPDGFDIKTDAQDIYSSM